MMKLTEGKQMQVSETFWNEIKKKSGLSLYIRDANPSTCSVQVLLYSAITAEGSFFVLLCLKGMLIEKNLVFFTQWRTLWGKAFL